MDVKRLALSETYVSPKGVKSVQLTIDGGSVYWLVEALPVVFEPRSYDGNEQPRVSLCLSTTQAVDAQISNLDDAVVALATQNSAALFGKQLTEELVRDRYTPILYKKAPNPNMFRPKLITAGRNATKCWDAATRAQMDPPLAWKDLQVSAKVLIRGLWFQGNSFGVSAEVTDALITAPRVECPWA
jgi:hypothetical protein